ncbi:magnesium transporter CorA family protein [Aspergillus stella-maris]|uniref:magnesium transporter CorA family protein n=1 Tax=Aspergillus stella-maris TaxID=1810926 RepID=UPI003CCDF31A
MSRPQSTSQQKAPLSPFPGEGRRPASKRANASGLLDSHPPSADTRHTPELGTGSGTGTTSGSKKKRKKNRNRKHRNRRPSFLASEDSNVNAPPTVPEAEPLNTMAENRARARGAAPFYKVGGNLSNTSLESEALLDHRHQPMMRPRRESRLGQTFRPGSMSNSFSSRPFQSRGKSSYADDSEDEPDDRTPLVRPSSSRTAKTPGYGGADSGSSPFTFRQRRRSNQSDASQRSPRDAPSHDINNPPSMPSTPLLGPEMGYNEALMTGAEYDFGLDRNRDDRFDDSRPRDMVIDVEGTPQRSRSSPGSAAVSPHRTPHEGLLRRRTVPAEEDVCFPQEDASVIAEECAPALSRGDGRRRRRHKVWPDLSVLEDWSHEEEKEERAGLYRSKKISEPMLVEGRLRPQYRFWRREEEEAPYRFTYFNEEFQSTIHAQTIPELVQPGSSFRELFIPDPPELEDSTDEEESDSEEHRHSDYPTPTNRTANHSPHTRAATPSVNNDPHPHLNGRSELRTRTSIISEAVSESRASADIPREQAHNAPKPKRYGPRPTFWLDILCPTDAEMRVISKAFGIHALTAEDIMMQEAREKVELFRNYYFLNYRTFEQDPNSDNYLEPVNMYVVVFREGILSFHFSQTPHPANVRRRIRQLMDYLILSSDWISYALIDDITDVFGPLIQSIEDEVDDIDEMIMQMHSADSPVSSSPKEEQEQEVIPGPGEMLRRVGVCRKKVMGLYRLLSNKADVVKGFAKRCNEHWEVAPKSEIGLYLGDIQDHIMTMTSSLTYYETLLSRAHSNYLAQINIHMNERQEQTADVLGKLTVLGTIVLPLNIICGMWGMNVKVPGQEVDSLTWFYSIVGGLVLFAFASFLIAKRVYNIV